MCICSFGNPIKLSELECSGQFVEDSIDVCYWYYTACVIKLENDSAVLLNLEQKVDHTRLNMKV